MKSKSKLWIVAGGGALALVAAIIVSPTSDQSAPPVAVADSEPAPTAVTGSEAAIDSSLRDDRTTSEYNKPVPYVDENGVLMGYGTRIRFSSVADCSETYVETYQGDWVPAQDCGRKQLQVDHPYGHYSIEQLEIAANDMNDADAAYILAERFTMENWRQRRGEAHKYYMKAFLLTTDAEIYERMISEMGIFGGTWRTNGELDVARLSANYTMARVGQKFGIVGEERVNRYAEAAEGSDDIDLNRLNQDADDIYQSLVAARGRIQ